MKAVVLAAGEGKRMKPISDKIPKMMIPILDKPFLEYVLMEIKKAGIKDIVIVISPKNGDKIKDYFQDGKKLGLNINYVLQEKRNGTADAISKAKKYLDTEYFLVHYGDSLTETNLPLKLLKNFKKESDLDTYLTMRKEENTSRYGVARFEGKNIAEIVEKPEKGKEPSNMVMMGVFILKTKSFFDSIEGIKFEYEKMEFPAEYIIKKGGKVRGWIFSGKRVDMGNPADIISASKLLASKLSCGNFYIGKNVSFGECSEIKNSFVNSNTKIGKNSILENSYVMGNCKIGNNCKIKNSIICCDIEDEKNLENETTI